MITDDGNKWHYLAVKNLSELVRGITCRVDMPRKHEKIKYLPGKKSLKTPFIVCADLECLLKKYYLVKITLKILT